MILSHLPSCITHPYKLLSVLVWGDFFLICRFLSFLVCQNTPIPRQFFILCWRFFLLGFKKTIFVAFTFLYNSSASPDMLFYLLYQYTHIPAVSFPVLFTCVYYRKFQLHSDIKKPPLSRFKYRQHKNHIALLFPIKFPKNPSTASISYSASKWKYGNFGGQKQKPFITLLAPEVSM